MTTHAQFTPATAEPLFPDDVDQVRRSLKRQGYSATDRDIELAWCVWSITTARVRWLVPPAERRKLDQDVASMVELCMMDVSATELS